MTNKFECRINNYRISVLGLSVQGKGKPDNQDAFAFVNTDDVIVVAVADGLGSAIKSKIGAEIICNVLTEELTLRDIDFKQIRSDWQSRIDGNHLAHDTTFRRVHISKDGISIAGIGDGWAAVMVGEDCNSFEQQGLFGNQTDSIMSANAETRYQQETIEFDNNDFFVIISTDGFSEDIEKTDYKAFLKEMAKKLDVDMVRFEHDISNLLTDWPIETNHDDKTVVFIRGKCV